MHNTDRRWHVSGVAAYYMVTCAANLLYLFTHPTGMKWYLLPMAGLICSVLYFAWPTAGRRGLIALTIATLCFIGGSNGAAVMFHLVVLGLLLLPSFRARLRPASLTGV